MKKYKLSSKEITFALTLINDSMNLISPCDKNVWRMIGYVKVQIEHIMNIIECVYDTKEEKDFEVETLYYMRKKVDEMAKEIKEMEAK